MAAGNPKFGGTNGVTALDLGQIGGTRDVAGNAQATIREQVTADIAPTVFHQFPQSGVALADRMGLGGGIHTWRLDILSTTITISRTIKAEIEVYRHGRLRDEITGVYGPPVITQLAPTQLANQNGDFMSLQAVLDSFVLSDTQHLGDGRHLMRGTITFRLLQ